MLKREDVSIHKQYERQALKGGKNYLLVIGISQYSNGIGSLNNAASDAIAFRDCLLERYQFEKEYCISLLDKDATSDNVITQFDTLTTRLGENDNLVFYFSGHGSYINSIGTGFWLLADSKKNKRHTFLPNDEVMRFIRNSKARHIFGVVDSCFSGSLFRNQKQPILSHRYQYKSRYLLTSGRFETVEDGIPGKQSPFAHCILDHLKTNPEGLIWGGSLCRTVLDNFTYDSNIQHPCGEPLHGVGHRNGEFAFIKQGVDLATIPQNISEKDRPDSHVDEVHANTETSPTAHPFNIQSKRIGQLNINTGKEINNNYYASGKDNDKKEEQPKQTSKLQSVDFHLLLVNIKELENDLPKKRFLVKLIEGAQQTYRKQPKEGLFELQNIFLQSITDLSRELKGSSISKEGKEHLLNILDSLFSILDSSPFEKSTIEEIVNETQLVPIWYQIDLELSQKINNLLHIITSWCKSI